MMRQLPYTLEDIANPENLLGAWREFVRGKRMKRDVQIFALHLMDNIIELHDELLHHTYRHGGYQAFNICDPKPRNIHKASVRDRLVHHTIYRKLYPFFDNRFVADSFSCRKWKGTHRALNRFRACARKASHNHTRTCWVLKCDIKKFFASVDQEILMDILAKYIPDPNVLSLLNNVIGSFYSTHAGVGLPLGNLTSQLFVNIYMNEFDKFVRHALTAKYYVRYADDFVLLSHEKAWLEESIAHIDAFLRTKLKLTLHPDKLFLKTIASGVDFLGWVHFPYHRVLRTVTKRRMFKRVTLSPKEETYRSYLGLLSHGDTKKLQNELAKSYLLARDEN